jgi:hypothetical protein
MAETKISGKRYSKAVERPLETVKQFKAAFSGRKSFSEQFADDVERARAFLRRCGLLDCPMVVRLRATGEWACFTGQKPGELTGGSDLDSYILKVSGLARDSSEHIAARTIVLSAETQNPDRDRAIEAAYWLGRIHSLSVVYATEARDRSKGGRNPKKRGWAEILAAQISCWADIPGPHDPIELDGDDADFKIYRDGEKVVCRIRDGKGEREENLAKSSFEKRYLRPALQKRGHQQS